MLILNDLPYNHLARNTPLGEIHAKYRWKGASDKVAWRTVEVGSPKLINKTYNELGESWTKYDWWAIDGM